MTNAKGMEWLLRSRKTMIMLVDVYKMRKHTSGKLVSRALMRFCVYSRVRDNVAICDAVYRRPSLSTRDEWSNCEKKKQYWTGEWYVATNIAMPDRKKVIIPRCRDAGPRQANRQFPYLNAWAEKLPQNWRTNWSEFIQCFLTSARVVPVLHILFNKCTAFIQQCRARSVSLGRGNIDSNQKIPRRILFYVNNSWFSSPVLLEESSNEPWTIANGIIGESISRSVRFAPSWSMNVWDAADDCFETLVSVHFSSHLRLCLPYFY